MALNTFWVLTYAFLALDAQNVEDAGEFLDIAISGGIVFG